ncbi:MAG: APC family permease [Deltaproteobacteria bacterium]|nr:APC family permease [Deltaproteobacteria bacterium]
MTKPTASAHELKKDALYFWEVLAQSIANIAPAASPALIIPMVFASSGNGTWIAYAIATLAMVFMATQINTFASRSASPGALYTFTTQGLGPHWGSISGFALFLAYAFTAAATMAGFTNYAGVLLETLFQVKAGLALSAAIMLANIGALWWIARRDVQLSTRAMLLLEFASAGLILALTAAFFFRSGQLADPVQFAAEGMTPRGLRMALVLALFSFVGFESATALGNEAKKPLQAIPKSVLYSVVAVGVFFTLMAYTLVLAFRGGAVALDKSPSPLADLARFAGLPGLGLPLVVGALVGQFACALASVTAAARVMYSMARHGFFHPSAGRVHETHATPHVAVTGSILFAGAAPLALLVRGLAPMDVFGYLGSIATYGFLFSYMLVAVAAPVFLKARGELRSRNVLTAAITLLLLAIPIVGSVYPVPEAPYNYLPYIFLALMAAGTARVVLLAGRRSAR